jgi:hypothetical protein
VLALCIRVGVDAPSGTRCSTTRQQQSSSLTTGGCHTYVWRYEALATHNASPACVSCLLYALLSSVRLGSVVCAFWKSDVSE